MLKHENETLGMLEMLGIYYRIVAILSLVQTGEPTLLMTANAGNAGNGCPGW